MKYRSVFDIIGPIMLGPSSSHTAGAVRIGQLARRLFADTPTEVDVHFYGSFAETYQGHATDIAVVGGVMEMDLADPALPNSLQLAAQRGLTVRFFKEEAVPRHPNTVTLVLRNDHDEVAITGVSIGGGAVQITDYSGFPLTLSGENPTMLILHEDAYGAVAAVTGWLTRERINIAHMEVSRLMKGKTALMVIETDEPVKPDVIGRMLAEQHIHKIVVLDI